MDAAVKMRLATTASAEPRSTVRPHTIRLTERTTCPVCGRECPVVEITEHASACAHRRFGEGPRPPPPEKEKRTLQLEAAAVAEALLAEVFADTDCEAQSTGGEAPLYAHNESTQLIGAGASSEGRSTSHVKGGSWYARKRARKVARDVEELDNLLIKSSRVDLLGPSHPLLAAVHARRPPARQSPPAPTAQVAAPPTPPTATSPPPGPAASSEPPSSAPTPAPTTAPTTATTTPMAGALSAAGTASIEGAASTAATAAASALMAASSHTRQLSGCIMNGAGATGAAAPMDAVATHSSEVLPHGQPAPRSTSPLLLPPRAAHSSGEDGGEGARSSAATHGARVLGAGIWGVGRGGAEVDRWLTASKRWRPEPPRLVVVTAQRLPAAAAGGGGTAQSVPLGTWEQPLVAGALTLPTALPITPPMPAEATAAHVRSADAQQPVAQPSARAVAPEPRAGEGAGAAAPSRLAKGGTVVLRKSGEPRANKQRWTKAEDQMLRDAVAAEGPHNWSLIAEALPGRNEKQARERWVSQLRPDLNKSEWTAEEDADILRLHAVFGTSWAKIARELPGRSDQSVKNRYNNHLRPKPLPSLLSPKAHRAPSAAPAAAAVAAAQTSAAAPASATTTVASAANAAAWPLAAAAIAAPQVPAAAPAKASTAPPHAPGAQAAGISTARSGEGASADEHPRDDNILLCPATANG